MVKKKTKILSLLLSIIMILAVIPFTGLQLKVSAITMESLKKSLPEGSYWNHKGIDYDIYNKNRTAYNLSSTSTPCNHSEFGNVHCSYSNYNYSGKCGCNSFDGSTQCMGFARFCCSQLFGSAPNGSGNSGNGWTTTSIDNLKCGDYIRYKRTSDHYGHSVVVSDVSSNSITVLECNYDGKCGISWDRSISKSTLKGYYSTKCLTAGGVTSISNSLNIANNTLSNSVSFIKPIQSATVQGSGYEHQGVDLHAPVGTPVYAVASGTIQYSEWGHTVNRASYETAYSVKIRLDKPFTKNGVKYICAYYTHMSSLIYDVADDSSRSNTIHVSQGDLIGYSGTANYCPHLHFSFEGDASSNWKMMYTTDVCNMLGISLGQKWSNGQSDAPVIINEDCSSYRYYTVNTSSGLNVRTGPGTGYSKVTAYTNGTLLAIDKISDGWGHCSAGWVCLQYCKYQYGGEPVINTPAAPTLSLSSAADCQTGSVITVSWSAASDATGYTLYMKNSAGTVVKTIDWTTGTSATFMVNEGDGGTYYIYGYSGNSKYTSSQSNVVTVRAHDPSTVKFVDYDGKVISSQSVKYGASAVVPASPSRYGFTFSGWSGSYSNVTSDVTLTAQYTRNKYTVKFFNEDGKLLDTQRIYYESAAQAPDYTPSSGYNFVSWDKTFNYITQDTSVTAVVEWYNNDMSVIVSNLTANRDTDGTGVNVTYNVSNQKNAITSARAIVVLKTSEGKLVTTTESAAFSIKNNVTKTQEVFVPTSDGAYKAEVYIVANYKTAVPVSESESVVIDQGTTNWSSWSTTYPTGSNVFEVQQRTEYRYRDKKFTTGSSSSLSGWTKYNTTWVWSSYGSWSGWTDSYYSGSDYRQVETRTVGTGSYTPYHYYRYANASGSEGDYYSNGSWIYWEEVWPGYELTDPSFSGGFKYWYNGRNYHTYWACGDSHNEITKTQYRYRDRSQVYTYYFWQWGDYSDWSTTNYTATDNRAVESRTVYRFRTNDVVGTENNDGNIRNISGTVDSAYAGNDALLMIYKVDEASDYSNQYVEQLKINDDGSYSASFKLLSEPSVKSGDYTITLGLVGTNEAIYIGTIEAPKPEYTVTFYNEDGTVIDRQTVIEGENADIPEAPDKEGYHFLYWDSTATNVRDDLDVYAHYEINTYTVVFVNWSEETVSVQTYEHGQPIAPPEMNDTDSSKAISWDGLIEGAVTQNMLITAKYQTKTFNVRFIDWNNNLISSQTIEYGQAAEVPEALSAEDYIFYNWASDNDYTYVTEDTVVVPTYMFEETTEAPVISIDNGDYDSEQTVTITCPTEKAVIYYTIDGTDPNVDGAIEYTGPFVIDRTCELRTVATAFHKNNSCEETRYIAINTDHMISEWVPFNSIPSYVLDNIEEYSVTSEVGYQYKDLVCASSSAYAEQLEADGWTAEGEAYGEYSQWIVDSDPRESGILDGLIDPEVEEKTPEPEDTNLYRYSRWKYIDGTETKYSRVELDGVSGEWEYIKLENKISVSGFDGTAPVYKYNGEDWYNQTIVVEKVVPDYMLYRFRSKVITYSKWSAWTIESPSQSETREYITKDVYQYTEPKKYVVAVEGTNDGVFGDVEYFFNDANAVLSKQSKDFEIEGFDFNGAYRNPDYTDAWNFETDTVDESINLYLKWTPKTYTVTFVGIDGKVVETQRVKYLEYAESPDFADVEGYILCGYEPQSLLVTGDLTIKAKYVPESEYVKLTLDRSSYALYVGSSFTLNAEVTPNDAENTTVFWSSSDENVACVDDIGKVTAVGEGTATIYATCNATGYTDLCTVTVTKNVNDSIVISPNAKVSVDDANQLRGIKADTNTVDEVKDLFVNDNLRFFDVHGTEIFEDSLVGTGTTIKLMQGPTTLDTVIVVITGDMNCDGKINNRDVAMGTRYLVDKEAFGLAQVTAFDVNGDGKTNNRDASMLSRYLVGKETI